MALIRRGVDPGSLDFAHGRNSEIANSALPTLISRKSMTD